MPSTPPTASVTVRRESIVLPTYEPLPADKNPMFLEKRVYQGSSGKVYPLPFFDRVAEEKTDRTWDAVWLENEFLEVMILPEIGGRIHIGKDKTNGYDFFYRQDVIKPALVGLAGPWISGGVEFNWPQHHRPATFMPVDVEIERHDDGSVTVWCSDHDPLARMKGMHGVCLHPGKAFIELKVRAFNRTQSVQTFLWWTNVATRVHEAYQSFFPPDVTYVADHACRSMSEYPLCQGQYYGVDYAERAKNGVPESEVPRQYVPSSCGEKSALPLDVLGALSNPSKRRTPHSAIDYPPNDLSFYANIPVPTSYMCMGSQEDFFGGYDHREQAGVVHIANHHISPGKKQWTWGNHEFGYAWDRSLTDPDSHEECPPYIEIMAGVYTDNQPDFAFLMPGETKTWQQFWYPIQKIGPAHHANVNAAVTLTISEENARVGVSASGRFPKARISLKDARGKGQEWIADLEPGKPFIAEGRTPKNRFQDQTATLRVLASDGREIISYTPKRKEKSGVPPAATEPPAPGEIESVDELYITGLHLEQYRHATRDPLPYWREALRRDPDDARCNNAIGLWHYRRGEFAAAEAHFRKSIKRLTRRNANPCDGEPLYNLGLTLRQVGRNEEAYDAFYKAIWNQPWQSAGYHALAQLDCKRGDWASALNHLDLSLRVNTDDLGARNLRVIALRKLGREAEAEAQLAANRALDPLDWWARHLAGETILCDTQTKLDIALDFARTGLYREAVGLLEALPHMDRGARASSPALSRVSRESLSRSGEAADPGRGVAFPGSESSARTQTITGETSALPGDPRNAGTEPLVHYYLAWLHDTVGNAKAAKAASRTAAKAASDYCFPARLEEIAILETAMRLNPSDARAPYYLGNLFYDRRRHREAISLWEKAAKLDPKFSIVWRNLGIGYFNILKQPAKARAAYDKALRANLRDARLLYERDQLWKRLGENPRRRLRELEKRLDLVSQRDDLSVEICALFNQTGRHTDALGILSTRKFQPWEGGEGQALGQHVRTHLALGRRALGAGDAGKAREHFELALTSPRNLSEAKHLLANQSDIHYWLGVALEKLGDRAGAGHHWKLSAEFRGDFQDMSVRAFSEITYYSALSMEKLGKKAAAQKLLRNLLEYARQLLKARAKIDYFATSLPTMLLFDDDIQRRQNTTAKFLMAQAQLGLGRKAQAQKLLASVIARDPNHPLAADFLTSV